ncbi:hypothetical protein [Roseofilum capinflatum]|uniref:Uncharacterized protein n=1 Tax=Roseofilum capinflatum BLCC-M114 TaxID=3022440 RepID=A0ABT7B058_9CYAN|nr:hypothetical protein [Roseofilum capinflatum]MDJ1172557.1 hypothetical protein [Roseofilum capinflatum BLCC-M114]
MDKQICVLSCGHKYLTFGDRLSIGFKCDRASVVFCGAIVHPSCDRTHQLVFDVPDDRMLEQYQL